MPDLLTHVLFAYGVITLLSLRWAWLDQTYVSVGMAGALAPDLAKAYLVIDERSIEAALGLPFEWYGLHTLGGLAVLTMLMAFWVEREWRTRVFLVFALGGISHLFLDAFIKEPTGYSYPALWPLTYQRVPSGGLYLSTDYWPLLLAVGLSLLARGIVARRE